MTEMIMVDKLNAHKIEWDEIEARVLADDQGKKDVLTDDLFFESDGTVTIEGIQGYVIGDESKSQILGHLSPGGISYLARCDDELQAVNLNHWLYQRVGKTYFVRTRELDSGKKIVRAILSEQYSPINNLQVLDELYSVYGEDYSPVGLQLTDRYFGLKLTHENGVDVAPTNSKVGDVVHAGIMVSNSETGASSLRLSALLYRLVCSNGMVSPNELCGFRRVHKGRDFDMLSFFKNSSKEVYVKSHEMLELLKHSHTDTFRPELVPALMKHLRAKYGWGKSVAQAIEERLPFEGYSKFGLVQAVTEACKGSPNRVKYEADAGKILTKNIFNMATLAASQFSNN